MAQRIATVMAREPSRVFGIDDLCRAIPGVGAQQINSEIGRQARRGVAERVARGKYRWPPGANGAATAQGGNSRVT